MFTRILAALLAFVTLMGVAAPAMAGPRAYLVRCDMDTSPNTGRPIYTGEYRYLSQTYFYTFQSYCPASVELY